MILDTEVDDGQYNDAKFGKWRFKEYATSTACKNWCFIA